MYILRWFVFILLIVSSSALKKKVYLVVNKSGDLECSVKGCTDILISLNFSKLSSSRENGNPGHILYILPSR